MQLLDRRHGPAAPATVNLLRDVTAREAAYLCRSLRVQAAPQVSSFAEWAARRAGAADTDSLLPRAAAHGGAVSLNRIAEDFVEGLQVRCAFESALGSGCC